MRCRKRATKLISWELVDIKTNHVHVGRHQFAIEQKPLDEVFQNYVGMTAIRERCDGSRNFEALVD
jgi:hypothetical protein